MNAPATSDVLDRLRAKIRAGDLQPDADQERAAGRLAELAKALAQSTSPERKATGGFFSRLLRKPEPEAVAGPRGLYIYGDVGRGKSMLMDLFYDSVAVAPKRRVHFHEFMLEVQRRLHALRQRGAGQDPLRTLGLEIAAEARLLCFDEFHVVNIGDAMILGRLFETLFQAGVVVVATSNWPPDRLYENGLNRDRFLPFIELLKSRVDVLTLNGPTDFRLIHLRDLPVYLHPLGPGSTARLKAMLAALSDDAPAGATTLEVGSRRLEVPLAAGSVAMFTFTELCDRPLGAADYLALTERFTAVIVDGVPLLTPGRRNESRRFMTLVDALYERRTILILAAEGPAEHLYPEGDGAFEFQRTVSRLLEMQTRTYLEACRARRPEDLPATFTAFALTSDLS